MICQVIYEIVGTDQVIRFCARCHSDCWDNAKEYEQKHGVRLKIRKTL